MNPILRSSVGLLILATAASTTPRSASAQGAPPPCVYVRCFLSVQRDPPRVVQGAAGTRVATLGLFAPRIDLLEATSDSARLHYAAFRSAYNRGAAFKLVGLAAVVSGLIITAANHHGSTGLAVGLGVGALPLGIAGFAFSAKAEGHLDQAIGFYNRTLPDTP